MPRASALWSEQTVHYMDQMMRGVVDQRHRPQRQDRRACPRVGKTGTTSSFRDAWFCGFTGNYVAAVWYGNDDYSPTNKMQGAHMPAITWQKFMAYAHTNIEIKPVSGIDFKPAPFVRTADTGAAPAERPPTLQPEAAQKLVDIADRPARDARGRPRRRATGRDRCAPTSRKAFDPCGS